MTNKKMTDLNIPILSTIYTWILENGGKPYFHFEINSNCKLPSSFARDEKIVINLSPLACEDLLIDVGGISFRARFGGMEHQLYFPIQNLKAVICQELEFGIGFPLFKFKNEQQEEVAAVQQDQPQPEKAPKKPNHLTLVK